MRRPPCRANEAAGPSRGRHCVSAMWKERDRCAAAARSNDWLWSTFCAAMAARAKVSRCHVLWLCRRGPCLCGCGWSSRDWGAKKGQSCGSARQDQELTASSLFPETFLYFIIFIFWSKQIVYVRLCLWSCLQRTEAIVLLSHISFPWSQWLCTESKIAKLAALTNGSSLIFLFFAPKAAGANVNCLVMPESSI